MGIADKLKRMVAGREEQIKKGIAKTAAFADTKTGGKYRNQIGTAQHKLNEQLRGDQPRREGGQPPA